ncbi:hypothetical protein [Streptosporangium sp. NPDC003464]
MGPAPDTTASADIIAATTADRELGDAARARVAGGPADNTSRACARHRETFTAWCAPHHHTPLPATADGLKATIRRSKTDQARAEFCPSRWWAGRGELSTLSGPDSVSVAEMTLAVLPFI